MQNHPIDAAPGRTGPSDLLLAGLADPRVVLLAVGLLGLVVDLFVRPLSWVGLALIVLATSPWILQAWSQRSVRGASPPARPRVPDDSAAPAARPPRPQPAAAEAIRRGPLPEPAASRPAAAHVGHDGRPAAARPPQARADPARTV
jgi:hypothetical protein